MATSAISRPIGKRISREHFFESMKMILVAFIILLALTTSAQCQQTAEDWFNKGNDLSNQDKYDEAIKAYDEAIRLDPNKAGVWYNKGNALAKQGKYDDAIKAYDEAIKLNSSEPGYWNNKGNALRYGPKRYDEAIQAYDEAIKLNSSEPRYWNNKGNALAFSFNETTTYTFIKDIGKAKGVELIKVHFKNAFRGADTNLATIDRFWQVSDTNSSQVIINNSKYEVTITSGTPLRLGEGYELAIKFITIDGNRVYVELSKNGNVIDSAMIIPPQATDDLYIYSADIGSAEDVEMIKVHFKNVFRGSDQNLATIDRVWQVSDTNSSHVIMNNSDRLTLTSGTPLMLGEGYELAIRSIDIAGNKAYLELSKNGSVIDSTMIIPPQATDDLYIYSADIGYAEDVEMIKVHFINAIRGSEQNIATVDRIWQVSDTNSSQAITNNSDRLTLTSGTPLTLGEGYELAIKAIDINGNKAYLELSKNGSVIDDRILIPPAPVLHNKGLDLDDQGKYGEAISAFDKAIEIDPQYAAAWTDKGNALEQLERYDDALIAYNKVIELDPENALAWFHKGYALGKLGELNESIKAYDKTIKIDPNFAMAWNNKAANLLDLGINNEALHASEKAIGIDSKLAIAWRNKGNALNGLARYDEAIQSYNKASSINQTYSVSMIDKGNSHYNAGEYVAAIRYYDEAIKQDPKDEYAWYNKAQSLRMLHRDSEAKAAYAKARELGYSGIMTFMEMTA